MKSLSFVQKLAGIFIFSLLLVGGGAFLSLNQLFKAYQRDQLVAFQELSQFSGRMLVTALDTRIKEVREWASSHNSPDASAQFSSWLEQHPEIDGLFYKEKSGQVLVKSPFRKGSLASDFAVLEAEPPLENIEYKDSVWVSEPRKLDQLQGHYQAPWYGVIITAPTPDGKGHWVAYSNFSWAEKVAFDLADQLKVNGMTYMDIHIIDQSGTIFLDLDPADFKTSAEYERDFDTLIKESLGAESEEVAKELRDQTSRAFYAFHPEHNESQWMSYYPVRHPSFASEQAWGILLTSPPRALFAEAYAARTQFYLIFSFLFFAALGAMTFYLIRNARVLKTLRENLSHSAETLSSVAGQMISGSKNLSSSTQEQAAALEESSASLEEMTGMLESSLKHVDDSTVLVQKMNQHAVETGHSMNHVKGAMQEILAANDRIERLVRLMEEIGEKTQVIDEIVFQTRLLSFNASVEAERAGEHGRGFAVVAQEVGNLAQMSGKSAVEITSIVKNSVNEAKSIVLENRQKVESGSQFVMSSAQLIEQLQKASQEILVKMENLKSGSSEQAVGVKQVSLSMDSISGATQQNAALAEQTSANGDVLSQESGNLQDLVQSFARLMEGENRHVEPPVTRAVSKTTSPRPVAPPVPKSQTPSNVVPFKFNEKPVVSQAKPFAKPAGPAKTLSTGTGDGWDDL